MGRRNKRKNPKIREIRKDKYTGKHGEYRNRGHLKDDLQNLDSDPILSGVDTVSGYPDTTSGCLDTATSGVALQSVHYRKSYTPRPHRGDIWFANLGDHYDTCIQSGTRPVFIISNDTGNRFSKTCTVLPMTSKMKKMELPTHVRLSALSCFDTEALSESMLLAEQIITIDKSALVEKVAFVNDEGKLAEIDKAVRIHLGIAAGWEQPH
ncbi:MAG: type II toxin-antitoxin system PemK/MazF family toxin [Clostridiaceae bacterium]|nr:type II toxin-antitoxin system PemK/MazF family toxin [Clostridiaceae bacterium]